MTTLSKLPAPLLSWYGAGHRSLPWRQEVSPYRTWVSEIMLQQTRVAAVIPYFARFMAALPTVEALAAVDEPTLLSLWQGLGYYNRARNLRLAAKKIVGFHGGQFPHTYEEIRMLPGVGDYTAGAIASIAFGLPTPAVDGNVLRVVARLTDCHDNILAPATRRRVTEELAAVIPHDHPGDFNQALMELGATVCLPNTAPMCEACPCRGFCQGFAHGTAASLPVREKKEGRRKEEKTVFILRSGEYEAVRYRGEEAAGLPVGIPQRGGYSYGIRGGGAAGPMERHAPQMGKKSEGKAHFYPHRMGNDGVYHRHYGRRLERMAVAG